MVAYAGADLPGQPKPANSSTSECGASAQVMADGLSIILSDGQVRSVFVNVFGGITACDEVANGIKQALMVLSTRPRVRSWCGWTAMPSKKDVASWPSMRTHASGSPIPWTMAPGWRPSWLPRSRSWPMTSRPTTQARRPEMAIWLGTDSRIIVQGMTGSVTQAHPANAGQRFLSWSAE